MKLISKLPNISVRVIMGFAMLFVMANCSKSSQLQSSQLRANPAPDAGQEATKVTAEPTVNGSGGEAQAADDELEDDDTSTTVITKVEMECDHSVSAFVTQLENSQNCIVDQDCKVFPSCPIGCWCLYHKADEKKLTALVNRLKQPECQPYVKEFKCGKSPGEKACIDGKCGWKKDVEGDK